MSYLDDGFGWKLQSEQLKVANVKEGVYSKGSLISGVSSVVSL